jgi:hypothetical protein
VLKRVRALTGSLIRNPASLRDAPEWAASLSVERNPLYDGRPWLPFTARRWLRNHLDDESAVFEYGSGGSTLFLARISRHVTSVEHDAGWFASVARALAATGLDSYTHTLHEPQPAAAGSGDDGRYRSGRAEYAGQTFERYVTSVDLQPDRSLDLAIVDGRARVACVERCLPKIREGGHLMLDNSERAEYAPAFSLLAEYRRTDLEGLAPYRTYQWRTSTWRITGR